MYTFSTYFGENSTIDLINKLLLREAVACFPLLEVGRQYVGLFGGPRLLDLLHFHTYSKGKDGLKRLENKQDMSIACFVNPVFFLSWGACTLPRIWSFIQNKSYLIATSNQHKQRLKTSRKKQKLRGQSVNP